MTCECYDYQRNTEEEQINTKFWNELSSKFIDNIPGRLDKNTLKDGSKSLTRSKFNKPAAGDLISYISM